MIAARVALRIRALQASTFPVAEILVHDAPEIGAAFGAACMLHQRFLSLENRLLADDAATTKVPETHGDVTRHHATEED